MDGLIFSMDAHPAHQAIKAVYRGAEGEPASLLWICWHLSGGASHLPLARRLEAIEGMHLHWLRMALMRMRRALDRLIAL